MKIKWNGWLKLNKNELLSFIENQLNGVVETPRLDARFFIESFKEIPSMETIENFIERRKKNEPVSKIIGTKGFWALDFFVSKDVLDPRSDSETLIESVLTYFKEKDKPLEILDICTGSGCLLISLLYEYKNARGIGLDVSEKALEIAQKNGKGYNAKFVKDDIFKSDFAKNLGVFDIIISNPPYIPTEDIKELGENVRLYDPLLALDGGKDGLDAYRALAKQTGKLLKENGLVFFEIGIHQKEDVTKIMQNENFERIAVKKDLGGITRVLIFKKIDSLENK